MKVQFYISLVLGMFLSTSLYSQTSLYSDNKGITVFVSDAPQERIESSNSLSKAVLDINSGEIAVLIPISGFEFKKKLMRKHFNEQYLESDVFNDASFSGIVENLDYSLLTTNEKDFSVNGKLKIHGIEKDFDGLVKLAIDGDLIVGVTDFQINLEDFSIHIPRLFTKHISRTIQINCKLRLNPKK